MSASGPFWPSCFKLYDLNVNASKHLHCLSYINVHISIVTKVETNHIEQFLQIFYGVILVLSCNKCNPPPLPSFWPSCFRLYDLNVNASKHLHCLSYINVHISIVTKVETNHIEQFLQIFYGVILVLSCNKCNPPPLPSFP